MAGAVPPLRMTYLTALGPVEDNTHAVFAAAKESRVLKEVSVHRQNAISAENRLRERMNLERMEYHDHDGYVQEEMVTVKGVKKGTLVGLKDGSVATVI